jgi:DNA polymerase IV
VWAASRANERQARTIVLKLKTKEFISPTRSLTPAEPPTSCEELTTIALKLRGRVASKSQQLYRFVGVRLSNFALCQKPPLYESERDTAIEVEPPSFAG